MPQCELVVAEWREPQSEHVELLLDAPALASTLAPGQFAHVWTPGSLRRPISFSRATPGGRVGLLFRVVGAGTRWLASRRPGDRLNVLAPLGHGFPAPAPGPLLLVGGGVGIPPLFLAAQRWAATHPTTAVLGARTAGAVVMAEDFRVLGVPPTLTTDDGSLGEPGQVTGPVVRWLAQHDTGQVMACGPTPMLEAVARLVGDRLPCWLACEQRMGCGVGACLACVVPGVGADGQPVWMRVCRDGPVFSARRLWWAAGQGEG